MPDPCLHPVSNLRSLTLGQSLRLLPARNPHLVADLRYLTPDWWPSLPSDPVDSQLQPASSDRPVAPQTRLVSQSTTTGKTFNSVTVEDSPLSVTSPGEMPVFQPVRTTSQTTVSHSVTGTSDNIFS